MRGAGSGVIIDAANGHIITNNHVIEGVDEINVMLHNNKVQHKATLVGADPRTDLAVVKIEAEGLNEIEWGDSDELQVGHWVLAFGQPEGFRGTVTKGIVSAKGRVNLGIIGAPGGITGYEDFIQTDAAINPGNSGGALTDIHGRLVGINSAIATRGAPQFMGIGLAIPSNMARAVTEQLIDKGEVTRGWLGVVIGDFAEAPEEEMEKTFGHGKKDYGELKGGALVAAVEPGQPAEKAGMKPGDVITGYDGNEVVNSLELRRRVAETAIGRKVKVALVRIVEGKPEKVTAEVTIAKQPKDLAAATAAAGVTATDVGLSVQTVTPEMAKAFGVEGGAVVADVKADSRAAKSDIRRGDVITEVRYKGRVREVKTDDDFTAAIAGIPDGDSFVVTRIRRGRAKFVTIE
jgi:serine protease Do